MSDRELGLRIFDRPDDRRDTEELRRRSLSRESHPSGDQHSRAATADVPARRDDQRLSVGADWMEKARMARFDGSRWLLLDEIGGN